MIRDFDTKGQGSLEFLLMLAGAVLVAVIVITLLLSMVEPEPVDPFAWKDGHWECSEEQISGYDYLHWEEEECENCFVIRQSDWGFVPFGYECIAYHETATIFGYGGISPACEVAKKPIMECTKEIWVKS